MEKTGVWNPTFKEIIFYFSTGDISKSFDPSCNYVFEVTLFEISFALDEVCELEVSYTEKAAFITNNFGYYFYTARFCYLSEEI